MKVTPRAIVFNQCTGKGINKDCGMMQKNWQRGSKEIDGKTWVIRGRYLKSPAGGTNALHSSTLRRLWE